MLAGGGGGAAFLVDGMKPAMETAAEENAEQSQEKKGTQGSNNSLFKSFHSGGLKRFRPVLSLFQIALKQSLLRLRDFSRPFLHGLTAN